MPNNKTIIVQKGHRSRARGSSKPKSTLARARKNMSLGRPLTQRQKLALEAGLSRPRRRVIVQQNQQISGGKSSMLMSEVDTASKQVERAAAAKAVGNTGIVGGKVGETIGSILDQAAAYNPIISDSGRAWLNLALNPMGEDLPGMCGIPDGSATKSIVADMDKETSITFPRWSSSNVWKWNSTLAPNPEPEDFEDVSMLIVFPPTVYTQAQIRFYIGPPPTEVIPTTQTVFDALKSGADDEGRDIWPSVVPITDGGARYNAAADKFGWYMTRVCDEMALTQIIEAQSLRCVARGFTGIFNAPELKTQGFVMATQKHQGFALTTQELQQYSYTVVSSVDFENKTIKTVNIVGSPDEENAHPRVWTTASGDPSVEEIAALEKTERFEGKAIEGFYTPILSTARDRQYIAPTDATLELISDSVDSKGEPAREEAVSYLYRDVCLPDMNTGYTWFQSISRDASVLLKWRLVLEMVPREGSAIVPYAQKEPFDDEAALRAYWRVRPRLNKSYPASYNDNGILGGLLNGFGDLVGPIADAALSIIPGGTAIGGLVKPFLNFL